MNQYYKVNQTVELLLIPIKLSIKDWYLIIPQLKRLIINFEDDSKIELLYKHTIAQIVIKVEKKLSNKIVKDLKKEFTAKITVSEKFAIEHLLLEVGLFYTNDYVKILAQEIVNQLHKFDTNIPSLINIQN